ncbi:MAG: glycoside hydrolase family 127 protein [Pyrinomonadaceae bacterium]
MNFFNLTRRLFALSGLLLLLGVSGTPSLTPDFGVFETPSLTKSDPVKVKPFKLRQVQILDSPFKRAMERNAEYLLSLDADRLLHNTRKYAGLEPKGEIYGGWEARGIAGHTLGHYLTALSQQYAATGDVRFRERIDYIIGEMAECQKLYGDGYIGALPPLELETLRDFKKGKVDLDGNFNFKGGAWVPWYTEHKILAGLKDAWVLAGNATAKEVTLKLADWIDDLTRGLTDEQVQKMLRVEHGGMSETLADIYALTGDKKYLETARRFYHQAIMRPLLEKRDDLAGKHANTQIPKIIGEARVYEVSGDDNARNIAQFFWERVVEHHSYVIGGNSENEHFGPPDRLSERLGTATAETCNTYNMLKLTRHLFEWEPKRDYFDFYERALYNQILASQEPRRGMFTYFMSLKPGHFKTYSTPQDSFWCCVGSGMENHTKYNDSIYFHGADDLYVNLFIPSRLDWEEKGLVLEQRTAYPNDDRVEFKFTSQNEVALKLKIRSPAWATGEIKFRLNGKPVEAVISPEGYAEINRKWKKGDLLTATIPMAVRTEAMPDDANKVAFLYGPLVLAGDLGAVPERAAKFYAVDQWDNFHQPSAKDVPVFVTENKDLTTLVRRTKRNELVFRAVNLSGAGKVRLRPFNGIFYDYYNVYWDVMTPAQFKKREAAIKAEAERRAQIDARTIDEYRPGEQQSEVDHGQKGENTSSGEYRYRKFRHALDGGWFSFIAGVDPNRPLELICTYWGGETGNRTFDILIDGNVIATQTLNRDQPDNFFEVVYQIPEELTRGKKKVEVRFQAHPENMAGGLYGARILRKKPSDQ